MSDFYLIKLESAPSHVCQCCLSKNNLTNMMDNFIFEGNIEIYSEVIKKCFGIKIPDDGSAGYFICYICILRLRESYSFRIQVDRVQSKLKKKNDEDSTLETETVSDMLENDAEENTIKQEYSPEDEFRFCVEIKAPENEEKRKMMNTQEESKCALKKTSKKQNLLPKIKKETLIKIIKPSILTEQDDEPSNEDNSIDNVIINSKRIRYTGRKRSKEEIREYRRRYQIELHARAIPYKLDKTDVCCKICKETFTANANLVKHMPQHFPNSVCHICGKFAITNRHLTNHMRTHTPENVACQICNKVVKKTSMRRHMQKHTGDNFIYPCEKCPEKFNSYSTRINHMANVHQVEVLKYKCKICTKAYRISGYLSAHMRKFHLKERNHSCPECGKLFFSRREVQGHMVKHTKEKKFQCALCLKNYGRKTTLTQHMKIHNKDKQFKCTICERTFTQKCTLKGHMKIHEKSNTQQLGL